MQLNFIQLFALLALSTFSHAQTATSCTTSAATPAPSGYVCDQQGSIRNPSIILSKNTPDQVTCRGLCLNDQPQCISFSYGPKRTCTTYSMKIVTSQFKKSNSGMTFWNRMCYKTKCGLCANDGTSPCNGLCVNQQTDVNNCGRCGNVCPTGSSCISGSCGCPTGQFNDSSNCGRCGNVCPTGSSCISGSCGCPTGQFNDRSNCGACGNACNAISSCQSGTCAEQPFWLIGANSGTRADGAYLYSLDEVDNSDGAQINKETGFFYQDAPDYMIKQYTFDNSTGYIADDTQNRLAVFTPNPSAIPDVVLADSQSDSFRPLNCDISLDTGVLSCTYDFGAAGTGNAFSIDSRFGLQFSNGSLPTPISLKTTFTPPPTN